MTTSEATKACFRKFLDFSGRSSRPEFWRFVLFMFLGSIVCVILNAVLFGPTIEYVVKVSTDASGVQTQQNAAVQNYDGGWIGTVFSLVCLIPFLAVGWRRMHDTGRPGWLMIAIPAAGFAVAYGILYLNSYPILIDPSGIPDGIEMPSELHGQRSPAVFLIGWLIAFLALVATIVLLAGRTQIEPNKYGPPPV